MATSIFCFALAIVALTSLFVPVYAQTVFESIEKGVRVQVPAGYVVEDPEPLRPDVQQLLEDPELFGPEEQQLLGLPSSSLIVPQFLLHVCPEEFALPAIGGQHRCEDPPDIVYGPREGSGIIGSADAVHVIRFDNLRDRPEFEAVVRQNKNITVDDLVVFNTQFFIPQEGANVEFDIVQTTNTTVNSYPKGAQVPTTLPAKFADVIYTTNYIAVPQDGLPAVSIDYRGIFLHVLGPDGNTAYVLAYEQPTEEIAGALTNQTSPTSSWLPPAVAHVFNSFELVQ